MLTLLIGIPGSGKSTWTKEFDGVIVSSDAIRQEFWSVEDQTHNQEVFDIAEQRIREALSNHQDVCLDATNLTAYGRKKWIELAHEEHTDVQAVFFNVSVYACLRRNAMRKRHVPEDVILRMRNMLEPPSKDEGFVRIERRVL